MKKEYQLIFQWDASTIKHFDSIIDTESILRKNLQKKHSVDGHDMGVGEANIFVLTQFPIDAFNESMKILKGQDALLGVRVAYREVMKDDYVILWPEGLSNFEVQ
ncbi:hypothetical protein [Duganella sp. S19_KUP01_CR8]|uniref:hypothetical protein n=1 Tax=Duganella sp. S19_KUP01_CR8 TaxID=3025502 RepID=UPI002FCDC862